ncbi:MAG: DNA-binding protein [Planctomycetota bacterium]|nr:MAG: DNA-binding protein [Planctomycetota bacterium]
MELLDVKAVAQRLKVCARQVLKLAESGRCPQPVRLGRSVRWNAAEIDRFIERGCTMPSAEGKQNG